MVNENNSNLTGMRMRFSILSAGLLLLLLLSSCVLRNEQQAPLKIGLVLPLTGPAADIGNIYLEGATLAVEELNKANMLEKPIELVVEDTGSDAKNAVTAIQKLIEVNEIKFFATLVSSHGLALKPIAIEKNVLLFGDVAHPQMTGGSPLIFRHSNTADSEAEALIQKILEFKVKHVGVLYGNDDYGTVFNKHISKELVSRGIIVQSEAFDLKGVDFKTEVAKASRDTDAILVAGLGPAFNTVIKQLEESRYKGIILAGIGFPIFKTAQLGALVDGVYHTDYPYTYVENYEDFVNKFKTKYGKEPTIFHPLPYGTLELLVNAVKQAKNEDPIKVAATLRNLGEFKGTYETMQVNEKGDVLITPLVVKQFRYLEKK